MKRSTFLILTLLAQTAFAQGVAWDWVNGDISTDIGRGLTVAIDSKGNRFIAGVVYDPVIIKGDTIVPKGAYGRHLLLAKFAANGTFLWSKVWQRATGYIRKSIVLDRNDNIILAGRFEDSMMFEQYDLRAKGSGSFLAKLTSDGSVQWLNQLKPESPQSGGGNIEAIGCDSANNIYWFGSIGDTVLFGPSRLIADSIRAALVKLDPSGDVIWANLEGIWRNVETVESGMGLVLAVGKKSLAVIGAASGSLAYPTDTVAIDHNWSMIFTLSYGQQNGNLHYARHFPQTGWMDASTGDIAFGDEDLFVSGTFSGTLTLDTITFGTDIETSTDSYLLKLDSSGNVCWAKQYWQGSDLPLFSALTVHDSSVYATGGNVWDTMDFHGVRGYVKGIFVVEFDHGGRGKWMISSSGATLPYVQSVAVWGKELTIAGSFDMTIRFGDFVLEAKDGGLFLATIDRTKSAVRRSQQNSGQVFCYPNPASRSIRIDYPGNGPANIVIYSALGEKVLSQNMRSNHELDVSMLTAGTYLVRVISGKAHSSAFLQVAR